MTALPATFEASQAGEVLAGFANALASEPLEGPLNGAAEAFRDGIWRNFMATEGPTGQKWPDRVDNLPHPLLFKSGRMLEAAIGEGAGAVTEVGPRDALLGVDTGVVKYAGFHMTGTRKMPARPYYYAGSDTLDAMTDRVASETMRLLLG